MIILGIDPGYAILGYGILEMKGNKFSPLDFGAITTESNLPMPERLKIIYNEVTGIIEKFQPQVVAVEELFFFSNQKTAMFVSQARGVVLCACANAEVEIAEYTPLQIKQALVGYGRAEKSQVQSMVKSILGLREVPKPDDTADALAAAICHGHCAGHNKRMNEALTKMGKNSLTATVGERGIR